MPIFEYRCEDCQQVFETLVRKSDEQVLCSSCGSGQLEKQLSAPSLLSTQADTPCGAAPMPSCGAGACASCV